MKYFYLIFLVLLTINAKGQQCDLYGQVLNNAANTPLSKVEVHIIK